MRRTELNWIFSFEKAGDLPQKASRFKRAKKRRWRCTPRRGDRSNSFTKIVVFGLCLKINSGDKAHPYVSYEDIRLWMSSLAAGYWKKNYIALLSKQRYGYWFFIDVYKRICRQFIVQEILICFDPHANLQGQRYRVQTASWIINPETKRQREWLEPSKSIIHLLFVLFKGSRRWIVTDSCSCKTRSWSP